MPEIKPFRFQYLPENDSITIEGVKYSCDLFRAVGGAPPFSDECWYRFELDEKGMLVVHTVRKEDMYERPAESKPKARGIAIARGNLSVEVSQ